MGQAFPTPPLSRTRALDVIWQQQDDAGPSQGRFQRHQQPNWTERWGFFCSRHNFRKGLKAHAGAARTMRGAGLGTKVPFRPPRATP